MVEGPNIEETVHILMNSLFYLSVCNIEETVHILLNSLFYLSVCNIEETVHVLLDSLFYLSVCYKEETVHILLNSLFYLSVCYIIWKQSTRLSAKIYCRNLPMIIAAVVNNCNLPEVRTEPDLAQFPQNLSNMGENNICK